MKKTSSNSQLTETASCITCLLVLLLCLLPVSSIQASDQQDTPQKDPHYTDAGFFDIHVCNWPDRPAFFMVLFSTVHFNAVKSVEVMTPGKQPLTQLDLTRFRTIQDKDKPEKRVFINQVNIPPGASDGWYTARITLADGSEFSSRDLVKISRLPLTTGQIPANESEVAIPRSLQWDPVPGAAFYQVFIRDLWNEGELIYSSKLLDQPGLVLPEGLLEPGGYYSWIVHARDINEDVQLGDFNQGSLNRPATFSIAP